MEKKPKVALSYAWKEEDAGADAGAVGKIFDELEAAGIPVAWDRKSLEHGDSLKEFMRSVGTAECIYIFLSNDYLRSYNCMNELLIAWNHFDADQEKFPKHVTFWVMENARDVFNDEGRMARVDYWCHQEQQELKKLKKRAGKHAVTKEALRSERMGEYSRKLKPILEHVADRLNKPNFEEFRDWVIGRYPMKISCSKKPAATNVDYAKHAAALQSTFPSQVKQVEIILKNNEALRDFLVKRFRIAESSLAGQVAAIIPRFFAEWSEAILGLAVAYQKLENKEPVMRLASEILFFAMDPEYAQSLRSATEGERLCEIKVSSERSIYRSKHETSVRNVAEGIEEILICWTRDTAPRVTAPAKRKEAFAITPQMASDYGNLHARLLRILDISEGPLANEMLKRAIERMESVGHPVYAMVSEKNEKLLKEIRANGSPLEKLLVFIITEGHSIRPGSDPIWDDSVDRDLKELENVLDQL